MHRREFLKQTALAATASALPLTATHAFAEQPPAATPNPPAPPTSSTYPRFPTSDPAWKTTWDAALAVLAGNIHLMARYDHPVLVEGAVYPGIWQECAPQEGLVYGTLQRYVATPPGAPSAPG